MNFKEYGDCNNDTIMLLHGGGLSWWNYREEAEKLQESYHIIIPILDGHSDSDRKFTSIEDNAQEIIDYITSNYNGHVRLIGGLSLGGQILLEILSRKNDICDYAIIESALAIPMKATYKMIKPAFSMSYGLISKKWFSQMQFNSLKIRKDLFSEYYRDTCKIAKEDMIAFMEANSKYEIKDSFFFLNFSNNSSYFCPFNSFSFVEDTYLLMSSLNSANLNSYEPLFFLYLAKNSLRLDATSLASFSF